MRVAVAAEHEGGHVLDRDVELLREEVAEARGVEHAGHADHHVDRQAGEFLQRPHHRVERVGDADDEGVGGVFADAGADLLHHLEIDLQEIVAAHARLARNAGGDDDHVGALDRLVGLRAGIAHVEAVDRRGLGDVERLAVGDAFLDVEEDDVAELLQSDEMRERATDLTGADERDLLTAHEMPSPERGDEAMRGCGGSLARLPQ